MGKLNPKQVENLTEPGTYEDGDGLRLGVKPTGRKSWLLRFQLAGRRREMGLGSFPEVSLKKARQDASTKRTQLSDGIDPLAARDIERAAQREAQRASEAKQLKFETLATEYRDAHGAAWSEKWRKGWLRKLELYAFDHIGKLSAEDIGTPEVLKVLQPIWATKTRTADEVRGQIEQVLDAAKARNLRQGENPARWRGHLDNLLSRAEKKKARKREHFEALRWQDVPELMIKLRANSTPPSWAAQLLIMTSARAHMVRFARWDEFDLEACTWSLPEERMKMRVAILDPDSRPSLDLRGRLIVVDESSLSGPHNRDGDNFDETIVISSKDAGRIVLDSDPQSFYDAVRAKVGDWGLLPPLLAQTTSLPPFDRSAAESEQSVDLSIISNNVSVVQLINEETSSSNSNGEIASPLTPDELGSGVILSVGKTVDGFEPRQLSLNISDTRLNQLNIGVAGDLGTGKTQFLKSLILQISRASDANRGIKPRFLIFDYKSDFSSPDFVDATGAKVVKPYHLPLNLFDTTGMGESSAPWLDRFRFFADVLDKVYSGIDPVQRDKLKAAVRNAYEAASAQERQPTIYDIHAEYREILGGKSDAPMAIIDDLVDMEVFARTKGETKPFDEFFDGVVVISLSSMGQDDRSKNMLIAILLNMFYENMLKVPKRAFTGTDPQLRAIDSYLLVDEADNIMRYEFDVLRKLLLQGREFGTGVILASQFLRHFKVGATDYREPLLSWFIHKVPNITPAELGVLGFTSDLAELSERVKTLPNHHCLYKSFDISGEVIRGLPFYELIKEGNDSPA